MSVGRIHGGLNNQEGLLPPARSEWGQTLAANQGALIAQPLPIGTRRHNFGGTVGGVSVVAASFKPIVAPPGYFGDVPQSEQATVTAPEPWNRV